MKFAEFTPEMISRSVCLFREYHGLYEDDYEGIFYWDPETGNFGADYWSTAFGGGTCYDVKEFAYSPSQVYNDELPHEWKERIVKDLREEVKLLKEEKTKAVETEYGRWFNKYSYQKEAFAKFIAEFAENFERVVDEIDSIAFLLYYTHDCTSGSYKNNKETLKFAVKETLIEKVIKSCKNQPVAKRQRQVSTEGMERFEGEVISVKSEYSTYGLRSDWKTIFKVGISQGEGKKTVWFTAPKGYDPERGQKIEIFSKNCTEYERSIQVRRPVVNVLG